MGIFRAYDIRGLYGKDIDEKTFEQIARAFVEHSAPKKQLKIVVACDVRPSSPSMKKSVMAALVNAGVQVIDAGTIPTPLFYFSIVDLECDGGLMITASHNPPEYNGMKLCGKEKGLVKKIGYETGLAEIEKIYYKNPSPKGKGEITARDVTGDYEKHVLSRVKPTRGLRVALDCGNGVTGFVAPKLFKKLGCEVTELYCEPDPSFPNHLPDPTKEETLNDLINTVKSKKLDLGIALDADGDRVVFIDEKGGIIRGDVALAVFAEKILQKAPGTTFISEVKVSRGAFERIESLGGKTVMSRVGHAYLHDAMKTENAEAAGELSGHFYFKDNYVNDDGLFAAAKMLEILSAGEKLSELAARIPKYYSTPEIRIHCADDKKFSIVQKVGSALGKNHKVVTIDGVRVELPNAWGLVRASNTEPALTLRFEGKTEKDLKMVRELVSQELGKHGVKIE